MKETSIKLQGQNYRMIALSCEDVLNSLTLCEELKNELWKEDMSQELVTAMCENAVLGYLSVFQGDKNLFESPKKVLQTLSLDDLILIFETYVQSFCETPVFSQIEKSEIRI